MTNKKILVFGGTGFLGSSFLASLLKKNGYEVHALLYDGSFEFEHKNLIVHNGDICKEKTLSHVFENMDVVVNLTGQMASPDLYYELNTIGTLNILNNCVEHNVKKIIFSSSVKVYGLVKNCTEITVPQPVSQEGIIKLVAEKLHKYYSEKFKIPTVCLRFSNIYGPTMKKGVLYNFIRDIIQKNTVTINGDGEQKRSFIYINDAVSALMNALEYPCKSFEVFNISDDTTTSINTAVEMVQQILGVYATIQYKKDITWREETTDSINNNKAKKKLGHKPSITLEEGISLINKALRV